MNSMQTDTEFSRMISGIGQFIETSIDRSTSPETLELEFNRLARALFNLQFRSIPLYRNFCLGRGVSPESLRSWHEIPALPASAFKEYEVTSLPDSRRPYVFHSSGTTGETASRHFHDDESLALYRKAARAWFYPHFLEDLQPGEKIDTMILTPAWRSAPNSSLICMFETLREEWGSENSFFFGITAPKIGWQLETNAAIQFLKEQESKSRPLLVLGTAFSFVHLLEEMAGRQIRVVLPKASRALETGGYKGRSREVPSHELRAWMQRLLGLREEFILSEYGMCELSSQAYNGVAGNPQNSPPLFRFPPWARARLFSPESGRLARPGEIGLIQVMDLANARSVMAVQTEDLGILQEGGLQLLGRDPDAIPKGCSLMSL
jgi:hypothetical protein